MYNLKEITLIKKIYSFIQSNTKRNIPTSYKTIAKRFNLRIEEVKHFIHLMLYKYKLPLFFKFDTIIDDRTGKTLCHFCKQEHGKFRLIDKEMNSNGTFLKGIFVCDKCYYKIIKN